MDERKRGERYDNLEQFLAGEVAAALAEVGSDGLDLSELGDDLKDCALPQHDEVDASFAGPVCAALVAATRNPMPEPEPEPVEAAHNNAPEPALERSPFVRRVRDEIQWPVGTGGLTLRRWRSSRCVRWAVRWCSVCCSRSRSRA